jgi:ElaB/YqjD/DUF883 family membrane-anchored ribosome-binding protein
MIQIEPFGVDGVVICASRAIPAEEFTMAAAQDKSDIDVLKSDLAALRADLAALVEHVKGGAAQGAARQATSQLGDEAMQLYSRLAAEGARSVEALGSKVEQQPIASLLIAFAAGFLGGRLLSR